MESRQGRADTRLQLGLCLWGTTGASKTEVMVQECGKDTLCLGLRDTLSAGWAHGRKA